MFIKAGCIPEPIRPILLRYFIGIHMISYNSSSMSPILSYFTKTVLIVIDEAHRTTGNYAYNNLIKLFENANVGFRILALSATPVSKIENL
jgi:type I site-specific restriction-modification system R (restriction) subunit